MDKSSILPNIFGSPAKLPLEKSKNPAYRILTVAKNSGTELAFCKLKIRSRIFHGFFYACDKIRCVMTDCIEEPSGSPFSLVTVCQFCTVCHPLQLALKVTVSHLLKEPAYNV